MALCPKCGQHEISSQQAQCPGGCDLTDYWAQVTSPIAEDADESPATVPLAEAAEPAESAAPPAAEAVPEALPVAETFCPGCHAPVHPDARFCDHCGWPVVPHCPNCGADNRIGAEFCRSCGVRLSGAKPERRGRTRFCPTCGQSMASQHGGRRTETMPTRQAPRLPVAETVIPTSPPEAASEPPAVEPAPAAQAQLVVEMVPVENAVPVVESSIAETPPAPAALPVVEPVEAVLEEEPPPAKHFQLEVIRRDGSAVLAFPLKEGDNLVGVKSPGSGIMPVVDLAPFDTRKVISRRHAILRVVGNRILLADCGSTNGTEVNGAAVSRSPVEVNEDSDIAFAGLRCRIRPTPGPRS